MARRESPHCETCACPPDVEPTRGQVVPHTQEGSCNFCNRHLRTRPPGIAPHKVLHVRGSTTVSVRICRLCARELAPDLTNFAK